MCSLQALGLALLLTYATSRVNATFTEDASIADKTGFINLFAALLANIECAKDTSGCSAAFGIRPDDDDDHCFIACSSIAGSCRACCPDGLYYNPPTKYDKLGSCSTVSPYATSWAKLAPWHIMYLYCVFILSASWHIMLASQNEGLPWWGFCAISALPLVITKHIFARHALYIVYGVQYPTLSMANQ